jgi:hypothetical protein
VSSAHGQKLPDASAERSFEINPATDHEGVETSLTNVAFCSNEGTTWFDDFTVASIATTNTTVAIQKAVYLTSTNLVVGFRYQVQVSSDLLNWTNQGGVFTATNTIWRPTNYWDVSDWKGMFFRLKTSP